MAKQVVKLGLEFDTKSAIQSYRDLVSELSKGGADPKAIKQFTSAIEKAETELAQLAAEGSTGFTDSKGIEQYQKKVLKTVTSMQQLALRMQEFSKSGDNFPTSEVKKLEAEIEKLKKKITDAQKAAKDGLVKSLTTNGGFSKKEAEAIAETVKTEEQLIARLEEEKKLRDEIRKSAQPAAEKATNAIKDKAIARDTSGSQVVMDAVGMKGKKGVKAIREAVAASLQEGIREGWSAEDVKKNALEAMKNAGISEKLAKEFEAGFNLKTIETELKRVQDEINKNSAVKKYNEANKSYNQVASGSTENYSQFIAKSKEAEKAQQDLATAESQVNQAAINSANAQKKSADTAGQQASMAEQAANKFMQMSNAQKDSVKSTEALEGGFNRLADRLKYMFGFTAMFNRLRQIIRSTFNDIQALDKAYASIAYVTNETVADLWSTYDQYAGMAEKLGQSTADVIKASAIYRQQGLDTKEALELTTDTMKLATIAGNDYSTATQEMTAALRGFKMEMDEGGHVSDVYSELAAHAAASVDDIAQAMSRTASIANSAGMSFENTSAFLTQMIETTQESAENIGTSMKTIIARFTELKENVAGTADSEFDDLSFNKVDEALKSVGVSLKDTTGQFRNLDEVFLELSGKWSALDRNTQRYIATVAAGSRQQSRFIALMDNYDRTIELINTAADSEGKADEQFAKAADTIEFKLNAIKTKWEEFKLSIMDSGFVKGLLDTVNSVMDRLKNVKMPQIAIFSTFAILAAKNFALNFINTLKTTAKAWQEIGAKIGDKISSGFKKKSVKIKIETELEILKGQEKKLTEKLMSIQNMNDKYKKILLTVDLENPYLFDQIQQEYEKTMTTQQAEKATLDLVNEALGTQYTTANEAAAALEEHRQAVEQDKDALINVEAQYQQNQARQRQLNIEQQRSQAIGQALTQTVHSLVAAFSAMAAGTMKSSEAAKTFGISSVTAMGNIAMSVISTTVATQGLTAGFGALAAAVWSALWPILAIGAAVAAVAGIWYAIAKSSEKAKDAIDINKQLEKSTQKLNDAREKASDSKEELKDLENNKESVKDLTDEYETLHKKKIKTAEESQREKDLAEQIKDEYPEIINGVNDENNLIEISNNLLDDKLLKMDEEIKKQKELLLLQENEVANREADVDYYNSMAELQNILGTSLQMSSGISTDITGEDILDGDGSITEESIEYNAEIAEAFAEKIGYKDYDYYDEASRDKLAQAMNYALMEGKQLDESQWSEDEYKAINDIKKDVQNIRKESKQYDNKYELAKQVADQNHADKEEWERALIAGSQALDRENQKSFQELKQEGYIDSSDSNYKKSAENIEKNFGIDIEQGTINGKEIESSQKNDIKNLNNAFNEIVESGTTGWNTDDDYKDILDRMHGQARVVFQSWFPTEQDYKDFTDGGAMSDEDFTEAVLEKYYDSLSEYILKNELGVNEVDKNLVSAMGKVQKISAEGGKASFEEALQDAKELDEIMQNYANKPEYQDIIKGLIPNGYDINNLNQIKEALPQIFDNLPKDMTVNTAQALNEAWSNLSDKFGGKEYLNSVLNMLQENQIPQEQWSEWFNLDFTKITNQEEFDKFKKETIQNFKEAGYDDAEAMFNEIYEYAKKNGILTISIETDANYDKFMDSLDAAHEKVKELGDSIISITKDMRSNGEVSFSTFEKLKKSVEGLDGINIYDYVNIDNNGKITANEQQLKKLYEDQLIVKRQKIEETKQQLILEKDELIAQRDILKAQLDDVKVGGQINLTYQDMNESLIPQVENWIKIVNLMHQAAQDGQEVDINKFKPEASNKIDIKNQEIAEALRKQIQAEISGLDAQIKLKEKAINKLDLDSKYIAQENAAEYREFSLALNEAEQATNNLAKSQKDLAKAQQDVVDKQKALNDAIQEYNELLSGKDNRKSTLDLLYNYEESLKALADEESRLKDAFTDSSSYDDAAKNFKKLLDTTKKELLQWEAENQVRNTELGNMRNYLLNGVETIEDEYNGETISINLGDYVRIDENGIAAVAQDLLNAASIPDLWKNKIEEMASTYNKTLEEIRKTTDQISKKEKEMIKMHQDAVKGWADFESSIADELKKRYQEQIDDLKNKYDSMKEADDDYIDALSEAIEKQRKLREKESKYSDLAKKEKKLSLMNRDTSGANQVERLKLEQEIEKDRETLLDESINEVIDNMKLLYESQDELRQSEIELKEALLDDALYWNTTAENVASSFQSVDDYLNMITTDNKEFADMNAAQQQAFIIEQTDKFNQASQNAAVIAFNSIESIEERLQLSSEEVNTTVETTANAFVGEMARMAAETRTEMNDTMDSAIQKIVSAQQALNEANQKLTEAATKVNEIATTLNGMRYSGDGGGSEETRLNGQNNWEEAMRDSPGYESDRTSMDDINMNAFGISRESIQEEYTRVFKELDNTKIGCAQIFQNNDRINEDNIGTFANLFRKIVDNKYLKFTIDDGKIMIFKDRSKFESWNANNHLNGYATGGLVNYTGPAWVDGTPDRPEAFLSADDTERIGNAAKLLADIPALNPSSNISNTNTSFGDTNIEINLNIESISSDVDVESMLNRVKEEIVEIARPTGTNVILQQRI